HNAHSLDEAAAIDSGLHAIVPAFIHVFIHVFAHVFVPVFAHVSSSPGILISAGPSVNTEYTVLAGQIRARSTTSPPYGADAIAKCVPPLSSERARSPSARDSIRLPSSGIVLVSPTG